jgi:beta-propeller repeat-containing protein/hemolysin type calcium-binding protein
MKRALLRFGPFLIALVAVIWFAGSSGRRPTSSPSSERARAAVPAATSTDGAAAAYPRLPLSFVPNAGQSDRRVRYQAQAGGASFFFTKHEAVVALAGKEKGVALRLGFPGANRQVAITGERRQAGRVNYLLGRDPASWQTNLPTFGEVVYRQLWPGVDLRFRGAAGQLKYELEVAPGASVDAIRLAYTGAQRLAVDPRGSLLVRTPLGTLRDARPFSYQRIGEKRVPVASRFRLTGGTGYGFVVAEYDRRLPLIIDPGLQYSTYLGGSGFDYGEEIAVDAAGNAYVTGEADSTDLPTTAGALDTARSGCCDAYVSKLNPTGTALVYSTYLGGSNYDFGVGIAADAAGNAYVTGGTSSTDFPVPGAFDTTLGGTSDAFVAKLNPSGSALVYSTYLGGSSSDQGGGIAVDSTGSAYITGSITGSTDFPTTSGALDTALSGCCDAFVTKLSSTGSLTYSTYLGGSNADYGDGIAVDGTGSAYVTGQVYSADFPTSTGAFDTTLGGTHDAYATKLNAAGSALVYSTYLGGSADDVGSGIAVDGAGGAYVTGFTRSADFPVLGAVDTSLGGSADLFVTKVNGAGTGLAYSTYLGGSAEDFGGAIAVDRARSAYVAGQTFSADFPTTPGAFDTIRDGPRDAVVTKLTPDGSAMLNSTYLGGSSNDYAFGIAVTPPGSAHVTGEADSTDFPTSLGAIDTSLGGCCDAFVTKLDMSDADGDGIADEVDEQPTVVSDRFSDVALGGSTSGQIVAVGATPPSIRVEDHPDPTKGLRYTVGALTVGAGPCPPPAGAPCPRVEVRLDGKASVIRKSSPGTYTVTDPEASLTVETEVGGPAQVELVVNGQTNLIVIEAGEEATIREVDNDGNGSVDEATITPGQGDTIDVNGQPTSQPTTIGTSQAPTCNGTPATIYVNASGKIVGGPGNGSTYAGTLTGTGGADVMVGTNAKDKLLGKGGADLVCGLDGDDTVRGNAGADTLVGGNGKDVLEGAGGADILTGNAGADVFNGGEGRDRATDFNRSEGDTKQSVEQF